MKMQYHYAVTLLGTLNSQIHNHLGLLEKGVDVLGDYVLEVLPHVGGLLLDHLPDVDDHALDELPEAGDHLHHHLVGARHHLRHVLHGGVVIRLFGIELMMK